jgi:23S rRNA pseudouridine1911/1915/1917 synthase
MTEVLSLSVPSTLLGVRMDKVLTLLCPPEKALTRVRLQNLIKEGAVLVDSIPLKDPNYRFKCPVQLTIVLPLPEDPFPAAQELPLDILYEDEDLLVLNKAAGMVVHPAPGNRDNTLVNALLHHCGDSLSGIGGVRRPGIVHRLDKETSGLLVVAKNDKAHQGLSAQFQGRVLSRLYQAIVWGHFKSPAHRIEGAIGRHPVHRQKMALLKGESATRGKMAITHCKILKNLGTEATLVECRLETGRTHQIRVHLNSLGHGVVGDALYGQTPVRIRGFLNTLITENHWTLHRHALHAFQLKFLHPLTQEMLNFTAPLPEDMKFLMTALEESFIVKS